MNSKRSGEDGILDLIAEYFPNRHPLMPMGRGDDCALMEVPQAPSLHNTPLFAVTSDIFAENAHFRTSYFSAADIGHKALAVNISDLAGNGAEPCAFSLNLTLTEKQDFAWLEECFKAMAKLADTYGMALCGGDLTKVPLARTADGTQNGLDPLSVGGLNLGITAWGTYRHGGVPLMRHRSFAGQPEHSRFLMKEGDILFYIGKIGLARLGLFSLEESFDGTAHRKEQCLKQYPDGVNAHLRPMPLVAEGLALSRFAVRHPIHLMDISDGLMRDIPRLLSRQGIVLDGEKAFGADLVLDTENIHPEINAYCRAKNLDPVLFAYKGGEDYGLLGICAEESWEELKEYWQNAGTNADKSLQALHRLGTIRGNRITLNQKPAEEAGFDHFQ